MRLLHNYKIISAFVLILLTVIQTCINTHTHSYTHTFTLTHTHTLKHTHTYSLTHTHIHIHTNAHTYVDVRACLSDFNLHTTRPWN